MPVLLMRSCLQRNWMWKLIKLNTWGTQVIYILLWGNQVFWELKFVIYYRGWIAHWAQIVRVIIWKIFGGLNFNFKLLFFQMRHYLTFLQKFHVYLLHFYQKLHRYLLFSSKQCWIRLIRFSFVQISARRKASVAC